MPATITPSRIAATIVPEYLLSESVISGRSVRLSCPPSRRARRWEPASRRFQTRVFCAQSLHSHRIEPHDQLRVVVQRLDGDHAAHAKLRVTDAHPRPERHPGRLILVLVGISRRLFARAAPATSIRIGAEFVVREVSL